jgi:hypothetical protein
MIPPNPPVAAVVSARTVLARQGSLRRAKNGRALARCAPFRPVVVKRRAAPAGSRGREGYFLAMRPGRSQPTESVYTKSLTDPAFVPAIIP